MLRQVRLQGVEDLQRRIREAIARGRRPEPLLREISEILYDEVMENFDAQGRPKWPDLAASTKRRYAKKGYRLEPTLDRHAAGLVSSIQAFVTAGSAGVGTNKRYAAIHNFGGQIVQAARAQRLHFRANEKTGELGNRFVRKSRSNFSQLVYRKRAVIVMPRREFMTSSPAGISKIEAAAAEFIAGG